MGGIYAGIYTPTEAGAIGRIYVIVVGFFRKTLTLRVPYEGFEKMAKTSAMIMFVIAVAYLLARALVAGRISQIAAQALLEWANTKAVPGQGLKTREVFRAGPSPLETKSAWRGTPTWIWSGFLASSPVIRDTDLTPSSSSTTPTR